MPQPPATSLPNTSHRFRRLVRLARSQGKLRALCRLGRRLRESRFGGLWCRFCVVEVFNAPVAGLKRFRRVPKTFTVREANADDREALGTFFTKPDTVAQRLNRGDTCIIATACDEIAAAVWLTFGPNDYRDDWGELRCNVRIPEGVCWTFDGKGAKWGAWGALMAWLPGYLERRGATDVFTQIDVDNRISIDSHKSLGYRPAGMIARVGLRWLSWRRYRTGNLRWGRLPGKIGKLELDGSRR